MQTSTMRGAISLIALTLLGLITLPHEVRSESLQDVIAQRKFAQDWIDGKLQSENPPKVSYTGLPFTMRVSGHQAANSPAVVTIFTPSLRVLEKMSNGKIITFERHDQLVHPEKAGVQAILGGTTDFAPCFSVWDSEMYPLMGVMALPGVYPSTEMATVVSEELYDRYFRRDVEKQGVIMGRLKAGSSANLFSKKPIRTIADMAGLKFAVAGSVIQKIVQAVGGTAEVMSSNQLAQAFITGAVDAVIFPDGPAAIYGIAKAAKYRTALNTGHYNAEYCLSRKFWEALPRDLQIVFNAWARAQAQAETQLLYGVAEARLRENFRATGVEFIELDPAQQVLWSTKTSAVIDEWVRSQEAAGRPARQLIEDVKASVRRNQNLTPNDLMSRALNQPTVLNPIKP